jgi:hypothetical protein
MLRKLHGNFGWLLCNFWTRWFCNLSSNINFTFLHGILYIYVQWNKAVLWIRIYMDPHHVGNPDPDPHQSDKLDPEPRNRINLQMRRQNVWNMSLFEHFFKGLSLYLKA